jgi:hypothetical protein
VKRVPEISAFYWRRCALTGALIADDLLLMSLLLWQHQHVYNPANWHNMMYHSPLGWRVLRLVLDEAALMFWQRALLAHCALCCAWIFWLTWREWRLQKVRLNSTVLFEARE